MQDYSEGRLQEALEACGRGMSSAAAAKQFSVLRVTLMHRFKNKNKTVRMDLATNLDEFQESILDWWILECGKRRVVGYIGKVMSNLQKFYKVKFSC